MDKADITAALAARLVAQQFPQWAHLPVVPVAADGWDHTTFRLGDELSVRLPSRDAYVPQVEKEHRWLPVLARQLSLQVPEPVAMGRPSGEFPAPWSVYRWIDGEAATADRVPNLTALASGLALFLRELHAIDPDDGPPPGAHNFLRGGSVGTYDTRTRESIRLLAGEIDAEAATDTWEAALASTWDGPPVWVHGDVSPSNLLVVNGELHAVIDFGCAAVGDPACDLVMAWTSFSDESRRVFRDGLALDDATWRRARGWALWKALITVARGRRTGAGADADPRRFGRRRSAWEAIDLVLADHNRSP